MKNLPELGVTFWKLTSGKRLPFASNGLKVSSGFGKIV